MPSNLNTTMTRCAIQGCHGLHDPIACTSDISYKWATATICNVCYTNGYICVDGCSLRKAMVTRSHLHRHHFLKHQNDNMMGSDLSCDPPAHDSFDSLGDPVQLVVPPAILGSASLQCFLEKTIEEGMLVAIRHFVGGACFGSTSLSRGVIDTVPLHDTYIVLLISRLVFRIGSVHQLLLCSLLSVFMHARNWVHQRFPSHVPRWDEL